jgi:hypothetical protein
MLGLLNHGDDAMGHRAKRPRPATRPEAADAP